MQKLSIDVVKSKAKEASRLWLLGFREACCLHRVVILCLRSRKLSIRTGQCFLLNGFIFLGSMFILRLMVIPTLQRILPENCLQIYSQDSCSLDIVFKLYSLLRAGLIQLFYVLWFYPLYIFSFILSNIWYNDIAKYGFAAMRESGSVAVESSSKKESVTLQSSVQTEKPPGLDGVMIGIGEQVYSLLLLSFFFIEVYAIGFMPLIGKALNFLLLSWMYKWNFSEVNLENRLDFFQTSWAFFAGFGNPCVLAIFFFSPLESYAVIAMLYPLVHFHQFLTYLF
ncbi:hypothetical protein SAY86_000716 [Trapa natans]|uniref:Protein EI24 homolog n=1 Tax=Trapa natans TaxID=22666 RepID=A0AAN7M4G2_TRANT|nr:hypothetical protein SAY86_000716 [Trapa natans]